MVGELLEWRVPVTTLAPVVGSGVLVVALEWADVTVVMGPLVVGRGQLELLNWQNVRTGLVAENLGMSKCGTGLFKDIFLNFLASGNFGILFFDFSGAGRFLVSLGK